MPMHDSPRDQILHEMSRIGWFTAVSGEVDAPTGWFGYTWNRHNELADLKNIFSGSDGDALRMNGVDLEKFDWNDLVGNFLLVECSDGHIEVAEYPTLRGLRAEFEARDAIFLGWLAGETDLPGGEAYGYSPSAPQYLTGE